MNISSRILSIGLSSCFVVLVFELVRRKRLKEKYAILWGITGITIFLLAVSERLLGWVTQLFGIEVPINAVLFFGVFFIVLINLHFSMIISHLSEQNKGIVQKLALLEEKIRTSNKKEEK